MLSGVYKIVNTMTGKFYVGHSTNIKKRFARHRYELKRGRHHCVYLQRAWDKYGAAAFNFVIERECSEEEAIRLEQAFIDTCPDVYNVSRMAASGGDLITGHPNYEQICADKAAATRKTIDRMTPNERKQRFSRPGGLNPMYGRTHSAEARERISNANKGGPGPRGTKRSEETKRRLSQIASQRTGSKNPFYGRQHSEETKARVSAQKKGSLPTNSRPVVIDDVEYVSATAAGRALEVCTATILFRIGSANPRFAGYAYKTEVAV